MKPDAVFVRGIEFEASHGVTAAERRSTRRRLSARGLPQLAEIDGPAPEARVGLNDVDVAVSRRAFEIIPRRSCD